MRGENFYVRIRLMNNSIGDNEGISFGGWEERN